MTKRVLIIGAGGFIGGFIAAEGLKRGYEVWCGVRATTSRRFLDDPRLHFVTLDWDNPSQMAEALTTALPDGEKWEYMVYNLGATKCANFADFNRINYLYLQTFLKVVQDNSLTPDRFLYMSSLSALGPGDEKGYTKLSSSKIPTPNTRYGTSKIKAETLLDIATWMPWIIFRPTGVYGPHEQDYLMMIKSIDRHWDFGVGYRRQLLTFIYVEDLAAAIYDALQRAPIHRKYIISEDRAYTQSEFRKIVAEELGGKWVIPVRLPLWMVYVASTVAEKIAAAKMQASTLNRDKFRIMKQRNWDCDITPARKDFGFNPRFSLRDGLRETIKAYRQ